MGFIHSSSGIQSLREQEQGYLKSSRYTSSDTLGRLGLDPSEPPLLRPEPSRLWQGFAWTLGLGVAFWTVAGVLLSWLL